MSDPQPDAIKPRPPRAEPLQPDRPGSGDGSLPAGNGKPADADLERARTQSETAEKNVREGYD